MNKTKLWTAVLLTGVLAIWLAGGCSPKEQHEKKLRARAVELHLNIVKEDWEACQRMTDPAVVTKRGTDPVKGLYKIIGGLVKFAKIGPEDYQVEIVVFAPDLKAAEVKGSNRINHEWKPAKSSQWVMVNGQWFVTF